MYGEQAAEQHEKDQPTILVSDEADRMRADVRRRTQAARQEAYNRGWHDARYWPHDVQPRVYRPGVRPAVQPPEKGEN